MTSMPFYKKKGYTSDQQDSYQSVEKKELLYQGEQDLGNGMYRVEIFVSQGNDLIIASQHLTKSDSFIIEI